MSLRTKTKNFRLLTQNKGDTADFDIRTKLKIQYYIALKKKALINVDIHINKCHNLFKFTKNFNTSLRTSQERTLLSNRHVCQSCECTLLRSFIIFMSKISWNSYLQERSHVGNNKFNLVLQKLLMI